MEMPIPNPFSPVPMSHSAASAGRTANRTRQQQIKASLLATARALLAERGFHGFSLRELAERADTSKQSIFGKVGTKNDVLWAAVDDFMRCQLNLASSQFDYDWSARLFETVLGVCSFYPEYMRAVVDYLWCRPDALSRITHECASWLVPCLRDNVDLNLTSGFNYYAIARQLMMMNGSATFEWAVGTSSLEEYRSRGLSGPALFIGGLRHQASATHAATRPSC